MRTVIISGGTGALGRAVSDAFLEQGDRLVVPWIVKSERDEIAERQTEALEQERLVLPEADVSDEAGATEVARVAGPADVLVNGCGGFAGGSPVHQTDLEVWDQMYRINLRTAAALSRAVIPGMLTRGGGSLLFIASAAADARPAGLAAYSASKAGVMVLTQTLQNELGGSGIRANAVVPTTIDTPANREAMADADFSAWTPPARIAQVLVWLASRAAATVRGGLIPV